MHMNHTINRVVGSTLKELRKEADLTQRQMAARINVRQSVVSKLESGDRSLGFYEMFAYSDALNMNPDLLFDKVEHAMVTYPRTREQSRQQ